QYVHQTSWGVSTRIIGAIIMVHGDNSGLVLPPRIAPTQVMIIPIAQHKEGVLDKAYELKETLSNFRVKVDDSDKSPGWKFSEQEMRGIPVRVEIGPRDIEANQAIVARRDTGEKITVSLDNIAEEVNNILETMQNDMLERARKHRDDNTSTVSNYEDFKDVIANKQGFVKAMWCGDLACEEKIKEETGATSRCIPFEQEQIAETCICCDKEAKHMVYWGKAY
ncbi:MAG: proline--tRNA ligase, partial [Clostridiales bacterium]|nr:proline--tRNA ligase [Clostridiales bacterium]